MFHDYLTLRILVLLCVPACVLSLAGQVDPTDPKVFARTQLHLSNSEASALERGQPVVKTLTGTARREVATAGGIRIQGPAAAFVDRFRTLEGFKTSEFVLQLKKFSEPPRLDDLEPLTLDSGDIQSLRKCRVGACEVRLSAEDIRRFNREVDWKSPNAPQQAAALYKAVLFNHLTNYRAGGSEHLIEYEDDDTPLRLRDETNALLDVRPSLVDQVPAFRDHIRRYPHGELRNTEDFFYWSKEAFGFRPVIGLNHVTLYTVGTGADTIAMTTQIYASHYMDGSIAINTVISDPGGDGTGFYWFYLNRSRIGRLSGLLGALSRPIVQSRARAGLAKSLRQTKQRLEARQ